MKSLKSSYGKPMDESIEQVMAIPATDDEDLTLATHVQAMWSLAMPYITDATDLVFRDIASGRKTSSVVGGHQIIGPCLNIVLVRVPIGPTRAIADLLRQSRCLDSTPFEVLGFRDIIRETTD
jgi:hypothetical protein